MRVLAIARALALFFLVPVWGLPTLAAQQPPHCAQSLYCLFNQEAAASGSEGIHKYSQNLIGLVVPNPANRDAIRRLSIGLADRLATAEQAARAGNGRLVPEASVVKAFDDLMQEAGAPPSVRADVTAVHSFREHAAAINAFPALFSADRNGTNCNPGEAVFVLGLLISNDGELYEGNLDFAQELMRPHEWENQRGGSSAFRITGGPDSSRLLSFFSFHHNRAATAALFNHMARALGF